MIAGSISLQMHIGNDVQMDILENMWALDLSFSLLLFHICYSDCLLWLFQSVLCDCYVQYSSSLIVHFSRYFTTQLQLVINLY